MPTKLAERTIQSVISLKHRWRSPLNGMRSSANGLHPLPVELWEEIFSIATDADAYWAEKQGSWCTISNPFFTTTEEDLLRDPMACDNLGLLRTRHSIILVCKSWYFMGIPILWSHLQFNEKDSRNVATMIYSALKRNPTLASHVLRLTIKSVIFRRSNLLEPEKVLAVAKFVPLLTNIEAISCSLPYATHLYPSIQPGIVMLGNHGISGSSFIHNAVGSVNLMSRDSFWIHCRTLSLTLKKGLWDFQDIDRREIKFDNLVDFRLDVEYKGVLEWIRRYWNFPILKHLHIINTAWMDRMEFLNRVHFTLEKLQIYRNNYSGWSSEVLMPNLKEIQWVNVKSLHIWPRDNWYDLIKAPNLRRFVMSWHPYPKRRYSTHAVITSIIAATLHRYSSLMELVIIAPTGKWVHSSGEESRVILLLEDIAGWCERGVAVEMITGKNAERRRYTGGSFPMDEPDVLEHCYSIYVQPTYWSLSSLIL
jgi:hypothetical protein